MYSFASKVEAYSTWCKQLGLSAQQTTNSNWDIARVSTENMSEANPDTGTNLGVLVPPKRKQGRPRKNPLPVPGENNIVPHKSDGRGRKPRRKKSDITWPAVVDSDFIGKQVHGVLDGSFDAGYLLTVRIGDSQTVLRGVVFEPSLCVPISKSNDIAPNVNLVRRNEQIVPPMHQPAALTSPIASSSLPQLPITPPVHITAADISALKDDQSAPLPAASTGSIHGVSVTAQPESAFYKPLVTPHNHKDTVTPSGSGEREKVGSQLGEQLQTF